jgi:hypothetical protein
MASLSAHLREPGDHGHLGFHPSCAVCCETRLSGALPDDPIVSRRTQALVTAGVLALSSAAPAPVLAAGSDQGAVGTADPAGGSDSADDPEFHPADEQQTGDDDTDVDADDGEFDPDAGVDPAVSNRASDPTQGAGGGSVSPVPTTNTAKPVRNAKPSSGSAKPVAPQVPASAQPATPPAAADVPASPAADQRAVGPTALATAPGGLRKQRGRFAAEARARASADARAVLTHARSGTVVVRSAAKPASAPAKAVAARTTSRASAQTYVVQPAVVRPAVATRAGRRAAPGDRVHVVLGGESLWTIANDALGGRATVAQVAREVNRLWELNRTRIGTGDRDLLPVGTRLELK